MTTDNVPQDLCDNGQPWTILLVQSKNQFLSQKKLLNNQQDNKSRILTEPGPMVSAPPRNVMIRLPRRGPKALNTWAARSIAFPVPMYKSV